MLRRASRCAIRQRALRFLRKHRRLADDDAPAAPFRDRIVPEPEPEPDADTDQEIDRQHPRRAPDADDPTHATRHPRPRRRYSWAELMKCTLLLDVLTGPLCAGRRKLLAFLTDPRVVEKILARLELPTDSPPVAAARPPPKPALLFA